METIMQLAQQAGTHFCAIRDGEARGLKDDAPEWVRDIVRAAHGDMMPDDWRYEAIEDILELMAEADNDDDAQDVCPEADVYTADLLKWLSSRADRYAFVDEAVADYGYPDGGIMAAIAMGQEWEYREIAALLCDALAERADELNR